MMKPEIPANEKERLETLRALKILDTLPEERYDRLTRLAQRLFNVPVANITLIDEKRQWFKSKQGMDVPETPRDISFCAHAINGRGIMVVNDTSKDQRFTGHPYVTSDPSVRFYAGCPIAAPNRMQMGTICLVDHKPRQLNEPELQLLKSLGELVEKEISKNSDSITMELFGQAEERFFLRILRSVMDYSRAVRLPIGMLIVHAPQATGKNEKALLTPKMFVEIGRIVTKSVRLSDVVSTLGDDAFYVFLPMCDENGIKPVMDRLQKNLQELETELSESKPYKILYRHFIWTPKDPQTVDELMSKGLTLLEEVRLEGSTK